MSLIIVDKTSLTPTVTSSEAYVAFRDLGTRPICATCDDFSECPECSGDAPFKMPIVSGDLLYLQFRMSDLYNVDPQSPAYGWVNGEDPFYIEAELEFSSGETLDLDSQSIIAGKEVGYFNGSYQNLIINSARVKDYINEELIQGQCFRLNLTTYKIALPPYEILLGIFPAPPTAVQTVGTLYFNNVSNLFFQTDGSEWSAYTRVTTYFFSIRDGLFYEWNGTTLVVTEGMTETKTAYETCVTAWYQFTNCEQTVVVEGLHGEQDCRGYYYGGTVRFRDRYRIWASLEISSYRTDRTVNENEVTTDMKNYEVHSLRLMKGHPIQIIERFNNSLIGSTVYFDNNEYVNISDLEKNNETGLSWWSQLTAERLQCQTSTGCADEIFSTPLIICPDPNPETVGEPVHLIGELGDYDAEAVCGSTFIVPAATVVDQDGNVLGQVDAGETIEVTCGDPSGGGSPVLVTNSDDSFSVEVPCGDALELEDYTINVIQDGVTVETVTVPAMEDITININWV